MIDNESCASSEPEDVGLSTTPTNQHQIPVESRHRFDKLANNSISLRRNHAIAVANDGTSLYLFGGESKASDSGDVTILGDMYKFDSETSLWTEILPSDGNPWPQKRKGHSLICAGNNLYMFGGMKSLGNVIQRKSSTHQVHHSSHHLAKSSAPTAAPADSFVYFQEIWRFDSSGQWSEIETAEERKPAGRAFHTASLYENLMIVYGGYGCHEDPDIWIFNLDDTLWYRVADPSSYITKPPRRFGHVATVYRQFLYIFGGEQKNRLCDSSVWKFPLANLSLVPLGSRQQTTSPPADAKAAWTRLECVNAPQNKTSLAAARLERKWLMHGGSSKGAICNSFHEFDLLSEKWRVLTQLFHPTPLLDKHKADLVYFGDHIAAFVLTGGSKPAGSSVASHSHASMGYRVDFILPLNNQPYPAKLEDSFVGWQVREVLIHCRSVLAAKNGEIHRLKKSIQNTEGMSRQELTTLGNRYEALLRVEEDLRKQLAEKRIPVESGTAEQEALGMKIRNELELVLPGFVEICDRHARLTNRLTSNVQLQAKRGQIDYLETVLSELVVEYEDLISWSKKMGPQGKLNASLKPSEVLEKIKAGRKSILHRLKDVSHRYSDLVALEGDEGIVSERVSQSAKDKVAKCEETIQKYKEEKLHVETLQAQRLEDLQKVNDEILKDLQKDNDERLKELQKLNEERLEEMQRVSETRLEDLQRLSQDRLEKMQKLNETRLEDLQRLNEERVQELQKLHEERINDLQTQKDAYLNKYERMIKSYDKLERRYLSLLRGNDSWEDSVTEDEDELEQETQEGGSEESQGASESSEAPEDSAQDEGESLSASSSERETESNSRDSAVESRRNPPRRTNPRPKTLVVQDYDNKKEYYAKVKKVHLAVRNLFQREGVTDPPEAETWQAIRTQYARVTKHYYKMVEKFTEWTQETNKKAQATQEVELEGLEREYEELVTNYLENTETYVRDEKPAEIESRRVSAELALQENARQRKESSIILLQNVTDIREKCREIEEAYSELLGKFESLHTDYQVCSQELDVKNDKYAKLLSFYEHLKLKLQAPQPQQQKNELERVRTKRTSIVKTAIERTTTNSAAKTSSLSEEGDISTEYVATFKPILPRTTSNTYSQLDSETISTTDRRSERTITKGFSGPVYRSSLSSINSRLIDEQTRSVKAPTPIPLKAKRHTLIN